MRKEMASYYETTCEIQEFIIPLPFFTTPLWLKEERFVQGPADYSLCVCAVCDKEIERKYARMVLFFTIVQEDPPHYFWRARLSCCHQTEFGVSFYYCIFNVEHALKKILVIERAQRQESYECGLCKDKRCQFLSEPATLEDYMFMLCATFRKKSLDLISALSKNSFTVNCNNHECPRTTKGSEIMCLTCRRVRYCSKKCRRAHEYYHTRYQGCINFEKIWNW